MTNENLDYGTIFSCLWDDLKDGDSFSEKRPLLAHYTSIQTLERIMANNEIWFSNPLFMNDFEELRFGMSEGIFAFRQSEELKDACESSARYSILNEAFEHFIREFEEKHAFDTYVLCFSEHDKNDNDGRLSMWRGYGDNGSGATLVFDAGKLQAVDHSPILLLKVQYASQEERVELINKKIVELSNVIKKAQIPDDKLYIAAHSFIERLKTFSLFTKHKGFSEEQEWRAVYLNHRDTQERLKDMLHYFVGPRGLEPKLKFKIGPIADVTDDNFSLASFLDRIILGPSISSPLAAQSVRRMLEKVGKSELTARIHASTTPFRPT